MTVIAWDGKTLAADKRSTCAGHASTVTKLRRAPNGALMACSGDYDAGLMLMKWYEEGATGPYPDNCEGNDCRAYMLVIDTDGRVLRFERWPQPLVIEDKCYAMGSGRDYALAAMHLGHDARKAVEVASALDTGCGNGIDTLTLDA